MKKYKRNLPDCQEELAEGLAKKTKRCVERAAFGSNEESKTRVISDIPISCSSRRSPRAKDAI